MSSPQAGPASAQQLPQFRLDALQAAVGWTGPQRTHVIEVGRLAAFRDAIGDSVGDGVPPTFLACLVDTPPLLPEASLYGSGWLNGGDHFRYVSPIRVGETVVSQMRFTGAVEKQGSIGPIAILTFITTFVGGDGSILAEHVGTRIRR
jgi:MaoC dehydratase-like protein